VSSGRGLASAALRKNFDLKDPEDVMWILVQIPVAISH